MEVEEIKERYKMLPIWARLLIAVLIGAIPAVYVWFDEGDSLTDKLTEAQTQEDGARQKFEAARKKKANLPKLEEQLAFTEEQLLKAKKKLPDSYKIEDVLQKAATISKSTGAKLMAFDPGKEAKHTEPYRYVELPVSTEIEGHFSQVAAFFDRVIHLDGSIFLRHVELTRIEEAAQGARGGDDDGGGDGAGAGGKSAYQKAKDARQNLRVRGHFDLVVFRAMTDAEGRDGPAEGEAGPDGKPPKHNAPPQEPEKAAAPAAAAPPDAPPKPVDAAERDAPADVKDKKRWF